MLTQPGAPVGEIALQVEVRSDLACRGGHAVALVGYGTNGSSCANSWGTAWGDKGFAYASEAYINAAFYDESYGVIL